jgi:hypothetical protein
VTQCCTDKPISIDKINSNTIDTHIRTNQGELAKKAILETNVKTLTLDKNIDEDVELEAKEKKGINSNYAYVVLAIICMIRIAVNW